MSEDENAKTVEICLRNIINEVAAQTGHQAEDVRRIFDLAKYVSALEKASESGALVIAPRTMQ